MWCREKHPLLLAMEADEMIRGMFHSANVGTARKSSSDSLNELPTGEFLDGVSQILRAIDEILQMIAQIRGKVVLAFTEFST